MLCLHYQVAVDSVAERFRSRSPAVENSWIHAAHCPRAPRLAYRVQIQGGVVGGRMDRANLVYRTLVRWETCGWTRHGMLGCTGRLGSRRGGWAATQVRGVPAPPGLGSGRAVRFPRTWGSVIPGDVKLRSQATCHVLVTTTRSRALTRHAG